MKIRDVIGIESIFTYTGTGDFINALTTPYGTTTFKSTESGSTRRVTATDPAGDTEVLETNYLKTAAVPYSETAAPPDLGVLNGWLDHRNSFYWNKIQWKANPDNYTRAHIYHWLHGQDYTQMGGVLESEKAPLTNRVWYRYPDQTNNSAVGSQKQPSVVARLVGTTGQVVRRQYNGQEQITAETDPLGRRTDYIYEANNIDLKEVREKQGTVVTRSFTWDNRHLPLTITDAGGQTTTFAWTPEGLPSTTTNAKGETTTFVYYTADAPGRQRRSRVHQIDGPLPGPADITTFDYDTYGNTASITGPDGYSVQMAYDALDRLTKVTFPDGTFTETTWLALDPQTQRDRLGRITSYDYNSLRQLVKVTDPAGRAVNMRWCRCGSLKQLIDPMGRTTSWSHDIAGRVTAKQYADGSRITYDYHPDSGNLVKSVDESGQIKRFRYNLDGSLAGKEYEYHGTSRLTPNVSYTYDPDFPRLLSMTDGIGTTQYGYHPHAAGTGAGQLASVDGPFPDDTITYAYDPLGRVLQTAINGVPSSVVYDALGRVTSSTNVLGTFGLTYDGATSRALTMTRPNGVRTEYFYFNATGDFRLQRIAHLKADNTPVSAFDYTYDAAGRILTWGQQQDADPPAVWNIGYDDADQLTSVNVTGGASPVRSYAYTYDPAGNRLSQTVDALTTRYAYNNLNQLTAASPALPEATYEWDAENRLTAIVMGSHRSEFSYDGNSLCRRIREIENGTVVSDATYVWNGLRRAEERNVMGTTVTKRFLAGGMQVAQGAKAGNYLYTTDHLNSIREVVNIMAELEQRINYGPWGDSTFTTIDFGNEFGFTGHQSHAQSGLYLAPYRAFNPSVGRWINRDPIGETGGLNLFQYVSNDPASGMDPLGLFDAWDAGLVILEFTSGAADALTFGATEVDPGIRARS